MAKQTYAEKLKDPRWQRKRLEIMQRDDFTCTQCKDKTSTLHVHHKRYTGKNPWDYDNADLTTICENCHYNEHKENDFEIIEGGIYQVFDFVNKYPEVKKLFNKIENHKGDWDLHLRNELGWAPEDDEYYPSEYKMQVFKAIDNLVCFTEGCDVNYFINIRGSRISERFVINGEPVSNPINFYDYTRFYLHD